MNATINRNSLTLAWLPRELHVWGWRNGLELQALDTDFKCYEGARVSILISNKDLMFQCVVHSILTGYHNFFHFHLAVDIWRQVDWACAHFLVLTVEGQLRDIRKKGLSIPIKSETTIHREAVLEPGLNSCCIHSLFLGLDWLTVACPSYVEVLRLRYGHVRRSNLYLNLEFALLCHANARAKSSLIRCLSSFLDIYFASPFLLGLVHNTV